MADVADGGKLTRHHDTAAVMAAVKIVNEKRQRVADAALAVMRPQTRPESSGCPRPVSEPSSESASAKPMEMPAPSDAARPTRKASGLLWWRRPQRNRRQRRDRAIHQSRQARLDDLQNEKTPVRGVFFLPHVGASGIFPGEILLWRSAWLPLGEITQQLAHGGVRGFLNGALVKTPAFKLHDLRLLAHHVDAQRPHQPHGPVGMKPLTS